MNQIMASNELNFTNLWMRGILLLFMLFLSFIPTINETIPITMQNTDKNTIDGVVLNNEYRYNVTFGEGVFKLFWEIANEEEIYLGLVGQTEGWVTLGIDPEVRMKGADMLFGMVTSEGQAIAQDAYSRAEIGNDHPSDTILGGENNILEFNGTEESGTTTIEFRRFLVTGDEYDKDIPANGTLTIIWAIGNEDNFETSHAERGDGLLNMTTGGLTETDEEIPVEHYLILASSLFGGLFILLVVVDSAGRSKEKKITENSEDGGIT